VVKINANDNSIDLEDGTKVPYDVLAVNVGSKTRHTASVPGVWENSLTTRPINDLLPKIRVKENELKEKGVIPEVVVCGAGAAGVELSYAFKARWGQLFGQEIKVTLLGAKSDPIADQPKATIDQVKRTMEKIGINYVAGCYIKEIQKDRVVLEDGREFMCDAAIWATGADPQEVTTASDLDILKGYFRVNKYLQSTSHPNVFAGGDCITMEDYADKPYPTKAGVYAVREGPFIAENIVNYIDGKPLSEYVPQTGFLALLMTGDERAIGSKFGISFFGKWVWRMKDYIDVSFMQLFDPNNLFEDYKNKGTAKPIDNFQLFDESTESTKAIIEECKKKAYEMEPEVAAEILGCDPEEEDFHQRLQILTRMHFETDFREGVVNNFKPSYLVK